MQAVEQRIAVRKSKDVYSLVRQQDTVAKQELLEQSGLAPSTLNRILEELTEKGLLQEVGFGESTGGRRPILYCVNPQYAYAFGLEISRTRSMLVLTDLRQNIVGSTVWRMSEAVTPDMLLHEVAASAQYMLEVRGIPQSQVLGLGIGAVGPLDPAKGLVLDPLYFKAPGWRDVPVKERLEQALGVPVYLDNGANAALTGEYWAASFKKRHLLYVHVGAGIRTSMMTGGAIVYGAVDMEGAAGQMIIQAEGIPHREEGGNRGALESYVSIHALEREWNALGRIGGFAELASALEAEDEAAVELLRQAGVRMGIGLANLLNILHPEKVILGGPVANLHPAFFETAVESALQGVYYRHSYQAEFSRGELGEAAIAVGAAVLVMNRLTV